MKSDILFDLDGTLTDPKPGICACIRFALERLGKPCPPDQELETCIGPPLQESFARLLGDPALVPSAVAAYRERFKESGMYENTVYPGIEDLLVSLAPRARLWVATSKPQVFAEAILSHFRLDTYFTGVYGSALDGTRSDKGELLEYGRAREGWMPQSTVMVGDRRQDMDAAIRHAFAALGVLWGYGSRSELLEAGAGAVAETPLEAFGYLKRFQEYGNFL